MPFSPLVLLSALVTIVFLLIGLAILLRNRWFVGWIVGCFGLLCLGLGMIALLLTLDALNFNPAVQQQSLATISFKAVRAQEFDVKYTDNLGNESTFVIYGDLIQINADLLTAPAIFKKYGINDMVRLNDASSRYISLHDEQDKPNTVFLLPYRFNSFGFDIAKLFDRLSLENSYINLQTIDTPFHEIVDGGIYLITIDQQKSLQFVPISNASEAK